MTDSIPPPAAAPPEREVEVASPRNDPPTAASPERKVKVASPHNDPPTAASPEREVDDPPTAASQEREVEVASPHNDPPTAEPSQQEPDSPGALGLENDDANADSAFDDDDSASDTTSLRSNITKYRYENNRRYHAYKDGEYWGPNDETQNNQLDIAHHLYLLTMGNKLFLAPIKDNPQRVLDVGTGTGIWAIDFADQYPSAQVIGFDLSPTQPQWVSPNVQFEINDACELDWGYKKNSFDFIHVRAMYGSVADWPAFYHQALDHLAPGGWFQQIEMSVVLKSDDGTITDGHIFDQWGKVSLEAGDRFGKDLRIHEQIKGYMEDAGFDEIVETVYKWPVGPWSQDPHMKHVGMWNLLHWQEGIEGWSVALLTRVLGWSYTEVQAYLGKMRQGLKDRSIHSYHQINVVYGRKPILK